MDLTEELISGLAQEVTGSTKVAVGDHEIEFALTDVLPPPWLKPFQRRPVWTMNRFETLALCRSDG